MEFVLEEFHQNTPDEELIEDVKRVAALCQKESLTGKEYEAQGRFSLSTLRNRFGSWNEVLRRAGLSVERGRFKKHCYSIVKKMKISLRTSEESPSSSIEIMFPLRNMQNMESILMVKEEQGIKVGIIY